MGKVYWWKTADEGCMELHLSANKEEAGNPISMADTCPDVRGSCILYIHTYIDHNAITTLFGLYGDEIINIIVLADDERLLLIDGILYDMENMLVVRGVQQLIPSDDVIILDGMREICDNAFNNTLITSVTLPDSINKIGEGAFSNCVILEHINFNKGLEYIGNSAFELTFLESIILPRTLKYIGKKAFADMISAPYHGIKNGIEIISDDAFGYGSALHIPGSVKSLGTLKNACDLVFEEGVESISIEGIHYRQKLYLPRSLKHLSNDDLQINEYKIDYDHLYFHTKMAYADLRDEMDFVEKCYQRLEMLNTPIMAYGWIENVDGKRQLQLNGFSTSNTIDIRKVLTEDKNIHINISTPPSLKVMIYIAKLYNGLLGYSQAMTYAEDYILVPQKPKYKLSSRIKSNSDGETVLHIDSEITKDEIAYIAELHAGKIKDVQIGDDVSSLLYQDGVLYDTKDKCVLLSTNAGDVLIMDGMQKICRFAFRSVENVHLPDSIIEIDDYAFFRSNVQTVNIPEGVKCIGKSAFAYCRSLKDIVLPQSLEKIGEKAFYDCCSLTHINIPSKVKTIEKYTFYCCDSMKTVELAEGLEEIYDYAFELTALSNVTIPATVVTVERNAFIGTSIQ